MMSKTCPSMQRPFFGKLFNKGNEFRLFTAICWSVWNDWNCFIFQSKSTDVTIILAESPAPLLEAYDVDDNGAFPCPLFFLFSATVNWSRPVCWLDQA